MWLVHRKGEFRVVLCLKKDVGVCALCQLVLLGIQTQTFSANQKLKAIKRKCSSRLILRKRCSRNPTGRRKSHEGCDVWSMGCLLLDLFLRSRTAAKTWSDECFDTSSKIASRCGGRPVSIQAAARGSQEKLTTMEIGKKRLLHQLLQGESESQHLRQQRRRSLRRWKLEQQRLLHQLLQGESIGIPAVCGNGKQEPGADCDDGNRNNNDYCTNWLG